MRFVQYLLAFWTALLVYTVFSFVLGQNGLYAQKHLEAEHARLLQNYEALQHTNSELQNVRNNLLYDYDTVSVYTRQLGYGMKDETYIRIMGLDIAANMGVSIGQAQYFIPPIFVPDNTIKIISAFFGLAVLAFFIIRDVSFFK